ncbi:hypothetical protein ACD661_14550 [Legionella lytica]|uniref:Substrate of the Dot/Icm secretion system n=1 Tax=Legionella lytica TaxID=96232 RepID=A0ABW8DAP4_9GAMM
MLRNWQKKFPQSFKNHPNLFTELASSVQKILSDLLQELEEFELLNERSLNCILDHASNSVEFIGLITRMLKVGVNIELIPNFISQYVAAEGLDRAINLFDMSSFVYNEEHLSMFSMLTKVLANPLCQTIFDARMRSFSDYTIPDEPLLPQDANQIIQQLYDLKDDESKIRTFFDFFAQYRPLPCSQKYLMETDTASQVAIALELYCIAKIAAITTYQDALDVKEMIQLLQTHGGNETHFEAIKYLVAGNLEAENWASTKTYDQLMQEIWQTTAQPQTDLRDFSTLDENSNRTSQLVRTALNTPTLLFRQHVLGDKVTEAKTNNTISSLNN